MSLQNSVLDYMVPFFSKPAVGRLRVGSAARVRLYEKLHAFVSEGIPLQDAIQALSAEYLKISPIEPRGLMLADLDARLEQSEQLSWALMSWVPNSEATVIKSGEQSGDIETALESCAEATTSADKMMKTSRKAMIYPGILFTVLFVFIYLFSVMAIPRISVIADPSTWPAMASALYDLSMYVQNQWHTTIIAIIAILMAVKWSMSRTHGHLRFSIFDKIPPWSTYKNFKASIFLISLSAMMKSGTPLYKAIELIKENSEPYYKKKLQNVLSAIESNESLGDALSEHLMDTETGIDVRVFTAKISAGDSLRAAGKRSISDSLEKITLVSNMANTLALILVAAFVVWVYASFMSLTQALGANAMAI